MTQIERVAELFKTARGTETFLQWASNDLTQLMLGAARELARPGIPASSDAGAIGLALGKVLGASEIVDYLSSPFRAPQDSALVPHYGYEDIMKDEGYEHGE